MDQQQEIQALKLVVADLLDALKYALMGDSYEAERRRHMADESFRKAFIGHQKP